MAQRDEDMRGDYDLLANTRLHESREYRVSSYALGCAFLASANSVLLGYDIGVMSVAAVCIREYLNISPTEVEILVGCLNVCSLLGSLFSGAAADALGRRATIFVATNAFLLGAILMACAPSFGFLIVGRVVSGIGVGCSLTTSPLYTSEISPGLTRGLLSSFPEIFINIGILLGYIMNYALADLPEFLNWRLMLGVAALPALVVSVTVLFLPESPRWLVMNCRVDDAKRVIALTEPDVDADAQIGEMLRSKVEGGAWGEILLRPSSAVKRMMIAAVGINFFMQASGNDAVVYYTPQVLMDAGVSDRRTLLGITILMGLTKTIVCVVSALFMDRFGRRPLLLLGCAGMGFSLGVLGLGTKYLKLSGGQSPWAVGLCVVAICADFSFFSLGLGPVTWVYSSEIFPTRIRAAGTCVALSVNRIVSGVVSMTFLSLADIISFGGVFFVFAGVMMLGSVFVCVLVPETKGKTLEEIPGIFGYEEVPPN